MSDFREQMFPYLPSDRFSTFSCGHVVAREQVLTCVVPKGPTGMAFSFTYSSRKDERLVSGEYRTAPVCLTMLTSFAKMDELGHALVNLAALTPKGMVVFVPSYDFLDQVQTRWEQNGVQQRLSAKKEVRRFLRCLSSRDLDAAIPTGFLGAKVQRRCRNGAPRVRRRHRRGEICTCRQTASFSL